MRTTWSIVPGCVIDGRLDKTIDRRGKGCKGDLINIRIMLGNGNHFSVKVVPGEFFCDLIEVELEVRKKVQV